ncbi:hypothetical protein L198_04067 [Cryptococcus wingfieldii CBS 7118]|uniref:Uncharacterized protein n=1 Tax=Cryptococcus wingfieldii CBS 7118 TaxID=1295528 RepID=A0A1E3J662_9TREE|nr:hypothetical protein L198_04067 [Cryptococcus wingfieldii CBS 7118]ODN96353.1 hypothetical protein L198_04067 [Cryptococcus wingfieldii CBS 7118]
MMSTNQSVVDPQASLPASSQPSQPVSSLRLTRPASGPSLVSAPPSVSTGAKWKADEMRASQRASSTRDEEESGSEEEAAEGPVAKRARSSQGGRSGQAGRGGRGGRAERASRESSEWNKCSVDV